MWKLLDKLNLVQKQLNFRVSASLFWLMATVAGYVLLLQSWKVHATDEHLAMRSSGELSVENFGALTELLHTPGLEVEAAVVISVLAVSLIALTWLGVGLTVLGIAAIALGAGLPLTFSASTDEVGALILGVSPLALLFVSLLELARLGLALPGRVFAVARNVLIEAVRLKIGLVFIVALIFFLALLPNALGEDQPLRYRVQQWLQWGTGISFLLASLLTIFFSCASVAFEQRDRVIWQTMTKPVRAWQYVLGKWIGVMTLNLILLGVMASGVFMFTEYLRLQPAEGERAAYVRIDGTNGRNDARLMTQDRRILENQVLVARQSITPEGINYDTPEAEEQLTLVLNRILEDLQNREPDFVITEAYRAQRRQELRDMISLRSRSAPPEGSTREFVFTGLDRVPDDVQEITLRYRVDAGSNDPSQVYRLAFFINDDPVPMGNPGPGGFTINEAWRPIVLGTTQTLSLQKRNVVKNGQMTLQVYAHPANPRTSIFPPDGLEILAVRGSYSANFARIMTVMWIKLGFIAGVAILCSCFLSFPVACLVTLVVWFAAQSGSFLYESLSWFRTDTVKGETIWLNQVAAWVTKPIAWAMRGYSQVQPTAALADGRLLSWGELGNVLLLVAVWTAVALVVAVVIFRRRELALYSGK